MAESMISVLSRISLVQGYSRIREGWKHVEAGTKCSQNQNEIADLCFVSCVFTQDHNRGTPPYILAMSDDY